MLIAIGVPNSDNGKSEMMGLLSMLAYEIGKMGHEYAYLHKDTACIDYNRNEMFFEARDIKADALLMIDTDMGTTTANGIIKHFLSLDKDAATVVCYQGAWPYRPCVYQFVEEGVRNFGDIPDNPFRVDATGGAFLWISKRVLQSFERTIPGHNPFDIMYAPIYLHEDVAFCYRMKQKGLELWAEPRISIAHYKKQGVTSEHFEQAKKQIIESQKLESEKAEFLKSCLDRYVAEPLEAATLRA